MLLLVAHLSKCIKLFAIAPEIFKLYHDFKVPLHPRGFMALYKWFYLLTYEL